MTNLPTTSVPEASPAAGESHFHRNPGMSRRLPARSSPQASPTTLRRSRPVRRSPVRACISTCVPSNAAGSTTMPGHSSMTTPLPGIRVRGSARMGHAQNRATGTTGGRLIPDHRRLKESVPVLEQLSPLAITTLSGNESRQAAALAWDVIARIKVSTSRTQIVGATSSSTTSCPTWCRPSTGSTPSVSSPARRWSPVTVPRSWTVPPGCQTSGTLPRAHLGRYRQRRLPGHREGDNHR